SRSVVAPHRSRLFTDLVCSPRQATRITIEAVWPIQNKKLRTPDEESSACGEGSTPLAKAEQIRAFRVPFPRLSARLEGANERRERPMKYLHTMVRVSDIEESKRFYCDGLGLVESRRVDNEAGRFTLVFLNAAGDEHAQVE